MHIPLSSPSPHPLAGSPAVHTPMLPLSPGESQTPQVPLPVFQTIKPISRAFIPHTINPDLQDPLFPLQFHTSRSRHRPFPSSHRSHSPFPGLAMAGSKADGTQPRGSPSPGPPPTLADPWSLSPPQSWRQRHPPKLSRGPSGERVTHRCLPRGQSQTPGRGAGPGQRPPPPGRDPASAPR